MSIYSKLVDLPGTYSGEPGTSSQLTRHTTMAELLAAQMSTQNIKGRQLDPEDRAKLLGLLVHTDAADIARVIGCSPITIRSAATGGRLYGATRAGILSWLRTV